MVNDVVIRDTTPQADGEFGFGLAVAGGEVTGARLVLQRSASMGLSTVRPKTASSRVVLADVLIQQSGEAANVKSAGFGLSVLDGEVTLERLVLEQSRRANVVITPSDAPGGISPRVVILEGLIRSGGWGLLVNGAASVKLTRTMVDRTTEVGVSAVLGAKLEAEDLIVRDTASNEAARAGHGMQVAARAQVSITRALFSGNHEAGILVATEEAGSSAPVVSLRNIVVSKTQPAACATLPPGDPRRCSDGSTTGGGGCGIVATDRGVIRVEGFEVSESAMAGLQVAAGAELTASNGAIHHNVVGANVQIDGYDMTKVTGPTVRYYENESNLAASTLPVPELAPAPTGLP